MIQFLISGKNQKVTFAMLRCMNIRLIERTEASLNYGPAKIGFFFLQWSEDEISAILHLKRFFIISCGKKYS